MDQEKNTSSVAEKEMETARGESAGKERRDQPSKVSAVTENATTREG